MGQGKQDHTPVPMKDLWRLAWFTSHRDLPFQLQPCLVSSSVLCEMNKLSIWDSRERKGMGKERILTYKGFLLLLLLFVYY